MTNCHDCANNSGIEDQIFASFYSLFIALLFAVLIINQFQKRNTFPIKERSPYVVLLAIVLNLIRSLMFPLYFLLGPESYNPNTKIFSPPYNRLSDPQKNFILLSRTINTNLQDAIFLALTLRTIRIGVVFETKHNSYIVRKLFDNEKFICLVIILKYVLQVVFFYNIDQCLVNVFFPFDFEQNEFYICKTGWDYQFTQYWLQLDTVQNFIIPMTAFLLRRVPKHLSMSSEMIQLSVVYYFNYFLISLLKLTRTNLICVSFLPLEYFLVDLRNFISIIIVVLIPIMKSSERLLLLPPMISLDDNKLFLIQKDLYKNLKNFVNYQQQQYLELCDSNISNQQEYENLLKYKYCQVYIGLYQEINVLNYYQECESEQRLQKKKRRLDYIITKYVKKNLEAFPNDIINIIPPQLISTELKNFNHNVSVQANVSQQYDSNTISLLSENEKVYDPARNSSYCSTLRGNEIGLFYQYSYEQINRYLDDYKQTKSFQIHIKKQIETNEHINQRMVLFNMVSIDD